MFSKVLIANRGAIVSRILRTLRRLGIKSVVVYSEADRDAPYVRDADEAFSLGEGPASATYMDASKLLDVARKSGAQALHPGYGFLSENAEFIDQCEESGLVWLGPTSSQVKEFGYKHRARELASAAGVPLVPGSGILESLAQAEEAAEAVGYPIMLKSTAGGGGIGMQICNSVSELRLAFDSVQQLSMRNFGDGSVFLEAYISSARHLEVQIFGDGKGSVIAVGERDCSTQRRNQKIIEECPAPLISSTTREALHDTAVRLGEVVNYRSAGTVEFIYDISRQSFYFLEMNTRLQVEHGVTELVWAVDLVEWMVRLGSGHLPSVYGLKAGISPEGHAIQARVYAEDPIHGFRPSAGLLTEVEFPTTLQGARIDTWVEAGMEVTPLYDPMLAKVIAHGSTREEAINRLEAVLRASKLYGIATNRHWLCATIQQPPFVRATFSTRWLDGFADWTHNVCEVVAPGTLTTIQDWPGRVGYWGVGVPPSGPFDDWSFRLGNRMLGNSKDASGLEITVRGPTLKFYVATKLVVTGAQVPVQVNGNRVPQWHVVKIARGDMLEIGNVMAHGMRAYLLVSGGFKCPEYLGSRSTFTLGQFGGHCGRQLRIGDQLSLPVPDSTLGPFVVQPEIAVPELVKADHSWELRVIYGPHGAPDFFTAEYIESFFDCKWEVHYNSSRTGVRLIGPHPKWARANGGEAGLHPSNIHDNAYAFGTIDFTGDMPIILGPDGPSLGGFVCPATVIRADRWKIGQLAPGDKIQFKPVSVQTARLLECDQEQVLNGAPLTQPIVACHLGNPIFRQLEADDAGERLTYRLAGDDFLLIEFGMMEVNVALRFRAHAWMLWLEKKQIQGIIDLTPGIRSLQIHYNPMTISLDELMALLLNAETELKDLEGLELTTRKIRLPLSWDDEDCRKAIDHYAKSVRANAPWVPSNLEFIRRINGLASIDEVLETVFGASYLVLGLGDVYLGAPVATPLDPTHRLVTTKYNPARTWTAENSVGIGGAYLCVYGMEGPGGYQFVGRTLQMWNRYHKTDVFTKPWLLRFFDQLSFYSVSHEELMMIRKDFPQGKYKLDVEPVTFKLSKYLEELGQHEEMITTFKRKREAAFEDEIRMWHEKGLFTFEEQQQEISAEIDTTELASNEFAIHSPVSGSVWRLLVDVGDKVQAGQRVALIESMKMEFSVEASNDGTIHRLDTKTGAYVSSGQRIAVVRGL